MQDFAGVFDCLSQSKYETDSPAGLSLSSTDGQDVIEHEVGAAAEISQSKEPLSHDNSDTAENDAIDITLAEHHPAPPRNINAGANQQQQWSLLSFFGP